MSHRRGGAVLSATPRTKKEREQEVLKNALVAARRRGGECRRLVDKISGPIVVRGFDECPDIVLRHADGEEACCLIGVEHFRVDQLLEWNAKAGKQTSAALRVFNRFNRLGESVRSGKAQEMTDEQRGELGSIIDELLAAQGMESLDGFVQAFTNAFKSHLRRSASYRKSVTRIAGKGEGVKLALLIETHVDYSHFRYWDGYRESVPSDGELPLFRELVELFGSATGSIDYLILAMCPRFGNEVIDARIVNCSSLAASLSRQKAKTIEYLGYSRSLAILEMTDGVERKSHIGAGNDGGGVIFLPFLAEGESLNNNEVFRRDMDDFARALELRKEHKPFLATFGVSMFLELFGDYGLRDLAPGTRFDLYDLIRWKTQMGSDEWRIRDARFREAHGIKDELLKNSL